MEESLGRRIRYWRERRGLSLDELAKASGCAKSFLSEIEHDVKSPKIAKLQLIAAALHILPSHLINPPTRTSGGSLCERYLDLCEEYHQLRLQFHETRAATLGLLNAHQALLDGLQL